MSGRCLGCGKLWGCVCNTPIRTLPHWQPATTQTVVPVDEKRLRAERRERIATACLAALLSHDGWERLSAPYLTQHAVGYADELINELDREAKP